MKEASVILFGVVLGLLIIIFNQERTIKTANDLVYLQKEQISSQKITIDYQVTELEQEKDLRYEAVMQCLNNK